MPRDLRMYRPRLRFAVEFDVPQQQPSVDERGNAHVPSAPMSTFRMVQIREEGRDLTGSSSNRPTASSWNLLREPSPTAMKLVIGSTITRLGLKRFDLLVDTRQVHFQAVHGRTGPRETAAGPSSPTAPDSRPMERMLRSSWDSDSSKAKYRQRSPRRQQASAKLAARLVLPVPAVPDNRTLLPR